MFLLTLEVQYLLRPSGSVNIVLPGYFLLSHCTDLKNKNNCIMHTDMCCKHNYLCRDVTWSQFFMWLLLTDMDIE